MAYESESPLSTGAPNNSTDAANAVVSGVWNKASLSSSSDLDYFKINVAIAGLIKLDFSNTLVTSTETWKVALLDVNGDYLTQLGATSVGTPVVSGTANTGTTLVVSGLTADVGVGSRFTFSTSAADTTIYTVTGATNRSGGISTLTLDTAMSATPTASTPLVFAPTQSNLAGGSSSFTGNVSASGAYYVKVSAANWSDADYQVKATFVPTLESTLSNDTKSSAVDAGNRLVANAWMTGALSSQTDADVWLLSTAAASSFTIDFAAASGDDNAPEWDIALATWNGQALTTVQGVALSASVGKSGTFVIDSAKYNSAASYVVTVTAKSGVTYDAGSYMLRVRGDNLDLNDTPVITVDTVGSGKPNDYITTDVVRSLKVSTAAVSSKVALNSLFTVSDADVTAGTQTIANYKVALTTATGQSATGSIQIIDGNSTTTYTNGQLMTAAQMAKAYLVAGTTQGNLDLVIQAYDSSNASDASGSSSNVHQTVRLVSESTGVTTTTDGVLTLTERAVSGESGYNESLSFKLNNAPSSPVLVYLEQASPSQLTLSKSLLTFTADNYATAQSVTVNAVADSLTEGSHTGVLKFRVVSNDSAYDGLSMDSQTFQIADPVNHLPQGKVTLGGQAQVGQALSASTSGISDADTLGEFNFQWERQSGQTWAPIANANTNAYMLTADDVGSLVRLKVSYLDGLKNAESVTSDPTSAVLRAGYAMTGGVHTWKSSATKLQDVAISSGGQTASTDSAGGFSMVGLTQSTGSALFDVSASKTVSGTTASANGISLTDVLATLKVYLGKDLPVEYKSSYNFVAADFDANGVVNLTDVLSLLKYYLGRSTSVVPTWAFVDAADVDSSGNITGASGTVSKNATTLHALDVDLTSSTPIELVGVLRGDVDGSWLPT